MKSFAMVLLAAVLFWMNRKDRKRLVWGASALLAVLLLRPPQARGQGFLSGVTAVLQTINTTLGTLLTTINTIQHDVQSIQQATVWPQTMIQQARGYAAGWLNTYQRPMQLLSQYTPSSATLPQALALEQVMANRTGSDQSQLNTRYQQVFGRVPTDGRMSPADQNLADLDDALTMDTLEQVKRGEQVNVTVRTVGDQLETMSTSAAPGTASYLTATALVTMLRSQAASQKMLAAYLRLEGAHLAHRTAKWKGSVAATQDLQQSVGHILNPH